MAAKSDSNVRVIAHNRRARFNYEIGETFEAGIALTGTEVKSLRQGKATIAESYADSAAASCGWSMPTSRNTCKAAASTMRPNAFASFCFTGARSTS